MSETHARWMKIALLEAQKAYKIGLRKKPWVKTSLAPGSKVVTDYLVKSGTQKYLNHLDSLLN